VKELENLLVSKKREYIQNKNIDNVCKGFPETESLFFVLNKLEKRGTSHVHAFSQKETILHINLNGGTCSTITIP
jgi:hypothetical protein